jgi:hypothetical protein
MKSIVHKTLHRQQMIKQQEYHKIWGDIRCSRRINRYRYSCGSWGINGSLYLIISTLMTILVVSLFSNIQHAHTCSTDLSMQMWLWLLFKTKNKNLILVLYFNVYTHKLWQCFYLKSEDTKRWSEAVHRSRTHYRKRLHGIYNTTKLKFNAFMQVFF